MTNENDDKLTGILSTAMQGMLDTPGASKPPADLDAIVLRALSSTGAPSIDQPSNPSPHPKVRPMRMLVKFALAASIAVALTALTWFGPGDSTKPVHANTMLAAALLPFRDAQTITFRMVGTELESDDSLVMECAIDNQGRYRDEYLGCIQIGDRVKGEGIILNLAGKTAVRIGSGVKTGRGPGRPATKAEAADMFDTIRSFAEADIDKSTPLGEKEFDGQTLWGFRIRTFDIWIDPQTSKTVRVETEASVPGTNHLTGKRQTFHRKFVRTDFEIDPDLPADYFDMVVPKGYLLQEADGTPVKQY